MRARLVAYGSALVLGLLVSVACRPHYSPNESVEGAPESCCKLANEKMTAFAGCRLAHHCRRDEPIWLRGAVKCTAVDGARCEGGRCCELQPMYGAPNSPLNWDENKAPKPTPTEPAT